MKVAFALFALFAFSQAAHSYWYAGSTSTNATGLTGNPSPRATYAVVTAGACANGGAQTGYQKFTINSTVPSFWYITGLVEYDLIGYSQLQVYTGAFDPANPCTNLLTIVDDGSTAPHLEDILWLAPGTYDVVITTTSATVEGLFAVHADSSKGQWNVQVTDNWVNTPYYGTATCQSYSSAAPYANFTFTPALNGNYDIFFFSYNSSDISPTFIATLYNGTVPFLGTGTSATPADPCTGASWVQSEYSSSSFVSVSKSYYEAAAMMNVALSNTTAYTVMLTGWNTGEYNAYGYWYRPTVFSALGDTANFLAPEVSGDNIDIPCTGDTAGHVWNSHVMTAVGYTTVVADIGVFPSGSSFDDQTCIYLGNNGGTKYTVAPLNCTGIISCSDYGNVAASGLLGQTYTIIETPYFSGATYAGEEYTLYIYTGLQLGPSPAPSTSSTGDLLSSSDASSVFVAASVLVAALLF